MHHKKLLLILAVFLATSVACKKKEGENPPGTTPTPPVGEIAQSAKNRVHFKGDLRLARDYAITLGIDERTLCQELGLYSCTGNVHKVALGGVDPYEGGVFEPATQTGVTTPLIVERIALAGCTQRVDLDFADPTGALIFRNVDVDTSGKLVDPMATEVEAAVATLTRRAWLRDPRGNEVAHIRDLYQQIESAGEAEPARQWATASCMVVLTSMEALFY